MIVTALETNHLTALVQPRPDSTTIADGPISSYSFVVKIWHNLQRPTHTMGSPSYNSYSFLRYPKFISGGAKKWWFIHQVSESLVGPSMAPLFWLASYSSQDCSSQTSRILRQRHTFPTHCSFELLQLIWIHLVFAYLASVYWQYSHACYGDYCHDTSLAILQIVAVIVTIINPALK